MTAYISVLKFLQVRVKSITHFKIVIALYMPVSFFKLCHSVDSIDSISVDTDTADPRRFDRGKYCLLHVCRDSFY